MKLIDIVDARFSIQKLVAQDLPLPVAYKLYKLIGVVNQHLEFYGNELAKPGCDKEALDNMVIEDYCPEKITVIMSDDIKLSASDINYLEPFINFVEVSE